MKTLENQEIGELISEITEKGFSGMEIDLIPGEGIDSGNWASVTVTNYDMREEDGTIAVESPDLAECLRIIVDSIRRMRGEPTLAEEVEAMIYQQEQHAQTLINCGPGAKCACGSPFLIVEKKLTMAVELATGEVCFTEKPKPFTIEDGEIARCPNCRNWYQLRA